MEDIMNKKIIALLILSIHFSTKPLALELFAGAMAGRAMSSPTVRTAGWVATGYMLHTPVGKKIASFSFMQARQMVSRLMYGSGHQIAANATTPNLIDASFRSIQLAGKNSMNLFRAMPASIAALRQKVGALSFSNPFVGRTVSPFEASSSVASSMRKTFAGYKNNFSAGAATAGAGAAEGTYTAQQVNGMFPRITNNYYHSAPEHGSAKFWKGFAGGSFAAWTTNRWFDSREKKNNEGQKVVALSAPAMSLGR